MFPIDEDLEVITWKDAKEGNLFIRDYRSMNPLRRMMRNVKHAMITMEEEDRQNQKYILDANSSSEEEI